jgi:hypothetical protein
MLKSPPAGRGGKAMIITKNASSHGPSLSCSRRRLLQSVLLGPLLLARAAFGRGKNADGGQGEGAATFGRAKRCILVFLNGGPSQLDTWDMKPSATSEVRGELRPIQSAVPGIHVSELLPRMAALADRYKIVRSVTHDATVHTAGVYTMLTCTYHPAPTVDQTHAKLTDHPHLGAITARFRGWRGGMPPFVSLPTLFRAPPVEGIWPGQNAGFLGRRFDPFVIEGDKRTAQFCAPDGEVNTGICRKQLEGRGALQAQQRASEPHWGYSPAAAWDDL